MHLYLRLESSAMSASLQMHPGDLYTAESRISLLPIGMQTPVAMGDAFSDCNGNSAFSSWVEIILVKLVIFNGKPLVGF
jgi:hypothetical protein